jgi:GntR family transcriptional regulator
MTVSKAYSLLEREGMLTRRPGLPLVVRSLESDEMQSQKLERLRETLEPTITTIRQLGIDKSRAVKLFTEMLEDGRPEETGS